MDHHSSDCLPAENFPHSHLVDRVIARPSFPEFDKLGNTFFGDALVFWPKRMLSSHPLNHDYDPSPQRAPADRKDFSLAGAFQGGFPKKVSISLSLKGDDTVIMGNLTEIE